MNINHDLRSKFIQLVFPQFFKAVFYSGYKKKVMDGENSFNGTEMENATPHRRGPRGPPDEVKVISLSLKAILIVPTIFGNSLVFKAFYKFPSLGTASNIILVSLSVADSLTVLPFILHISFIALTLEKGVSIKCVVKPRALFGDHSAPRLNQRRARHRC